MNHYEAKHRIELNIGDGELGTPYVVVTCESAWDYRSLDCFDSDADGCKFVDWANNGMPEDFHLDKPLTLSFDADFEDDIAYAVVHRIGNVEVTS